MKTITGYCVVSDNDGHDYIIPYAKYDEFYEWIDSEDYEGGIEPDYAIRLEGGTLVFKEYEIK